MFEFLAQQSCLCNNWLLFLLQLLQPSLFCQNIWMKSAFEFKNSQNIGRWVDKSPVRNKRREKWTNQKYMELAVVQNTVWKVGRDTIALTSLLFSKFTIFHGLFHESWCFLLFSNYLKVISSFPLNGSVYSYIPKYTKKTNINNVSFLKNQTKIGRTVWSQ